MCESDSTDPRRIVTLIIERPSGNKRIDDYERFSWQRVTLLRAADGFRNPPFEQIMPAQCARPSRSKRTLTISPVSLSRWLIRLRRKSTTWKKSPAKIPRYRLSRERWVSASDKKIARPLPRTRIAKCNGSATCVPPSTMRYTYTYVSRTLIVPVTVTSCVMVAPVPP